MNKFISKSKFRALIMAVMLLPTSSFAAATLDDVVNALNKIYTFLDTQMMKNNWLGPQPNLQLTQSTNNAQATLSSTVTSITGGGVSDKSLLAVSSIIGPNANPSIGSSMLLFPAGDSLTAAPSTATVQSQAQAILSQMYGNCGDNAFNFEMLMSPSVYTKIQLPCSPLPQDPSAFANAYIQFAADLGNPISTYSINQLVSDNTLTADQANTLLATPEWQDFAQTRRHILAAQSAGLSNLYYLAKLRTPDPKTQQSPQSLADQVAYWRTTPPPEGSNQNSWYLQMQTALPAMVARETLFVLAEMQRELHDMHKENQRLLAIQSIMQISSLSPSKQILNLKLTQVQNKVSSITAPPSTTSTSSTSSTTSGTQTAPPGTTPPDISKYLPPQNK